MAPGTISEVSARDTGSLAAAEPGPRGVSSQSHWQALPSVIMMSLPVTEWARAESSPPASQSLADHACSESVATGVQRAETRGPVTSGPRV
eukprot:2020992-Rhodomonas_salina.1